MKKGTKKKSDKRKKYIKILVTIGTASTLGAVSIINHIFNIITSKDIIYILICLVLLSPTLYYCVDRILLYLDNKTKEQELTKRQKYQSDENKVKEQELTKRYANLLNVLKEINENKDQNTDYDCKIYEIKRKKTKTL